MIEHPKLYIWYKFRIGASFAKADRENSKFQRVVFHVFKCFNAIFDSETRLSEHFNSDILKASMFLSISSQFSAFSNLLTRRENDLYSIGQPAPSAL